MTFSDREDVSEEGGISRVARALELHALYLCYENTNY